MQDSQVAVLASDSNLKTFAGASWNTLERETQENCPRDKIEKSKLSDKSDMLEQCSSTPSEELVDCVVQDSQEENDMDDEDEDNVVLSFKSPFSLERNVYQVSKEFDLHETINLEDDDSVCKKDPPAYESDDRDLKRIRPVEDWGLMVKKELQEARFKNLV